MTGRPNKKALVDALDIYRDAMRPFIVRHLKRVPGQRIGACIRTALRDDQYNQFEQNINEGRSVEDAIDVNDFPRLVRFYRRDAFRDAFKPGSLVGSILYTIAEARNRVSHPDSQDVDLGYTVNLLNDIASVLTEINEPEQSEAVGP